MPIALLPDRAVLSVTGVDARTFLQSLATCDVETLTPGKAAFGALLTPQGKILFDFFLVCVDETTFLLDTAAAQAPALAKRLAMYRLRAKVAIAPKDDRVVAAWGDVAVTPPGVRFTDPRAADMGERIVIEDTVAEPATQAGDATVYAAHRIACGVPAGGIDFAWGEAFPHEVNMDLLHGVSFTKGCYVGQEVVSRMEHRATVRRRVLRATYAGAPPTTGSEIRAGEVLIGTVGSAVDGGALVAVRTDRLADVLAAGTIPTADGIALRITPLPAITPPR